MPVRPRSGSAPAVRHRGGHCPRHNAACAGTHLKHHRKHEGQSSLNDRGTATEAEQQAIVLPCSVLDLDGEVRRVSKPRRPPLTALQEAASVTSDLNSRGQTRYRRDGCLSQSSTRRCKQARARFRTPERTYKSEPLHRISMCRNTLPLCCDLDRSRHGSRPASGLLVTAKG